MTHTFRCCICRETIDGWGNNPYPLSTEEKALCCDMCNVIYVIPARIKQLASRRGGEQALDS